MIAGRRLTTSGPRDQRWRHRSVTNDDGRLSLSVITRRRRRRCLPDDCGSRIRQRHSVHDTRGPAARFNRKPRPPPPPSPADWTCPTSSSSAVDCTAVLPGGIETPPQRRLITQPAWSSTNRLDGPQCAGPSAVFRGETDEQPGRRGWCSSIRIWRGAGGQLGRRQTVVHCCRPDASSTTAASDNHWREEGRNARTARVPAHPPWRACSRARDALLWSSLWSRTQLVQVSISYTRTTYRVFRLLAWCVLSSVARPAADM